MYVALWYKHGKPMFGRAWNNGGVVQCSFAFQQSELKTEKELEGSIQVLQYIGDHNSLGFWYNWIPYSERFEKGPNEREIVRCGTMFPILWYNRREGPVLGYCDNTTEIAKFAFNGRVVTRTGGELADMKIIVREYEGGPPDCTCQACTTALNQTTSVMAAPGKSSSKTGVTKSSSKTNAAQMVPVTVARAHKRVNTNHWVDYRAGDVWPGENLVKALFRSLDTIPGENPDQYVALWYKNGEPVFGRIWNESGKIAANFSWNGLEFKNNIGSIQILAVMQERMRGFDYDWRPYDEVVGMQAEWVPVYVGYKNRDMAPVVIPLSGKLILGQTDLRSERASVGYGGTEHTMFGKAVHGCTVLCRKAKPGCFLETPTRDGTPDDVSVSMTATPLLR